MKYFIFFIGGIFLIPSQCFSQLDSNRHQLSGGISNFDGFTPHSVSLEYKSYFKKRAFYSASIDIYYSSKNIYNYSYADLEWQIAPGASIGVYYKFLKRCRINLGAQLNGFIGEGSGKVINDVNVQVEGSRKRLGMFLGPEINLEVRAFRIKSNEVSIFVEVHAGMGFMNVKYYINNVIQENYSQSYWELYGMSLIGIGYRF